jgi:hypothetical protein
MKSKKTISSQKISLRKRMGLPMKGLRLMQISGVSIPTSIPMVKSNSSPVGKPATDAAEIQYSADSFSSLVQQANQIPEVRSDVVDSFRARIQSGTYPSEADIANLTDTIGGHVLQLARSSLSS